MRRSRFNVEQIIGFLKENAAGGVCEELVPEVWVQRGDLLSLEG